MRKPSRDWLPSFTPCTAGASRRSQFERHLSQTIEHLVNSARKLANLAICLGSLTQLSRLKASPPRPAIGSVRYLFRACLYGVGDCKPVVPPFTRRQCG